MPTKRISSALNVAKHQSVVRYGLWSEIINLNDVTRVSSQVT